MIALMIKALTDEQTGLVVLGYGLVASLQSTYRHSVCIRQFKPTGPIMIRVMGWRSLYFNIVCSLVTVKSIHNIVKSQLQ
jgi:hypothetical protein